MSDRATLNEKSEFLELYIYNKKLLFPIFMYDINYSFLILLKYCTNCYYSLIRTWIRGLADKTVIAQNSARDERMKSSTVFCLGFVLIILISGETQPSIIDFLWQLPHISVVDSRGGRGGGGGRGGPRGGYRGGSRGGGRVVHSHWWSPNITGLSLVDSFPSDPCASCLMP